MNEHSTSDECCPLFHPERWDEKTHNWESKKFVVDSIPTLFHIPYPPMIGKKIARMSKMADESNTMSADKEEVLVLFHDPSAFKSEIYLSVTGEVPNENNVTISGTFVSKVFDGSYNAIPKFIKQMNEYLAETNKKAKDYYVHYAYCPVCMKKFGHNYMILFAEI